MRGGSLVGGRMKELTPTRDQGQPSRNNSGQITVAIVGRES